MANSSGTNAAVEKLALLASNLPHQFFQPLPPEVIRYWLEGNYTGGLAPSVAYDQLGWALMVRGFYRYRVTMTRNGKNRLSHRGYCVIDLFNGDIRCQGIRLKSSKKWKRIVDCVHPLLWRSDVSSIRQDPGERRARLTCALRLMATPTWQGASQIPEAFAHCWGSKGAHKDDDPNEQAIAISYIASQFEQDWHKINKTVKKLVKQQELKPPLGEAFSGFMVYARVPEADKPVTLKGTYSTFNAPTVSGTVKFTRIDDALL